MSGPHRQEQTAQRRGTAVRAGRRRPAVGRAQTSQGLCVGSAGGVAVYPTTRRSLPIISKTSQSTVIVPTAGWWSVLREVAAKSDGRYAHRAAKRGTHSRNSSTSALNWQPTQGSADLLVEEARVVLVRQLHHRLLAEEEGQWLAGV
jgi:hypothetical protein